MQYDEIMVRYGELSTKGRNQKNFIDRLGANVTKALHGFDQVKIHPQRDRMHIDLNGADSSQVMDRLKQVFGIQTFSPSLRVESDLKQLSSSG